MKKNKVLKILTAAALAAAFAMPQSRGSTNIVSFAETQEELQQKIADNEAYISSLDDKISDMDSNIAESKELQDLAYQKLTAQKEQIDLLNNDIYVKETEIYAKEVQINDKASEITGKEGEIDAKQDEIERVELNVAETEQQIANKTLEIEILDQKNSDNIYRFGQIISAMYMTDSDDYFAVLAGAADFYDIFIRSEILKSAGDQNLEFMRQLLDDIHKLEDDKVKLAEDIEELSENKRMLEEQKAELEEEKEKLKYEKDVLETERSNLYDDKAALDTRKKESESLSWKYNSEYNTYSQQITDFEQRQAYYVQQQKISREEIEAYEKQIDELIRQAQLAASNTVVYDYGEWRWPLDPQFKLITTYFGWDAPMNRNHGAIDIGNSGIAGANIYASKGGEVIVAKTSYIPGYDYGMYVVIDHGNGYQTLYAHMSAVYVGVGQMVNQGDVLGAVGSTGWSTGPHLHFEMRLNGSRIDPLGVVPIP